VTNDLEAVGYVLKLFGDVVTKVPQFAAAIGTAIAFWSVCDDLTRKMIG
jgi:hypothetical protein